MDNQLWIPLCLCALSRSPPKKFNIIVLNVWWSICVSRAEAGMSGMILENEYIHTPCMKSFKGSGGFRGVAKGAVAPPLPAISGNIKE